MIKTTLVALGLLSAVVITPVFADDSTAMSGASAVSGSTAVSGASAVSGSSSVSGADQMSQ